MAIYLDYEDVDQLLAQYDPRNWVEDPMKHIEAEGEASLEQRARLTGSLDVSYGPSEAEKLDIYPGNPVDRSEGMPVRIFFHGGGWRANSKEKACYAAELVVQNGGIYVAPDFAKIDQVPLDEIIRQSRAAVAWAYKNIANYRGNPNRIYVGGVSSGAHQAAMVAGTDWAEFGLPADTVKGVTLLSGIYDFYPFSLTPRKEELGLDEDGLQRRSPILNVPAGEMDLLLGVAELDSAEIHRQMDAYGDAWEATGKSSTRIEEKGQNHFSVSVAFGQAETELGQAGLRQMGLA